MCTLACVERAVWSPWVRRAVDGRSFERVGSGVGGGGLGWRLRTTSLLEITVMFWEEKKSTV